MGTTIRIDGLALVQFIFDYIPSVNEAVDKARAHWTVGRKHTETWRTQGRTAASLFMANCGPTVRGYLIQRRAFVWVRVFRAVEWPTYDVTNTYVKAIMDGFTDAMLWPDDDWPNVPNVLFGWQPYGPDEERVNKFVIEVHELDAFVVNGQEQVLPMGRIGERGT